MCFTCIEGIRECKHHSGPHLHNIHAKASTASNLCAFISHRTLLRVFCVYLYLHIHTDLYTLNIHKGVIKCAKGSCLPVLTLKSASGSKLGFIWYSLDYTWAAGHEYCCGQERVVAGSTSVEPSHLCTSQNRPAWRAGKAGDQSISWWATCEIWVEWFKGCRLSSQEPFDNLEDLVGKFTFKVHFLRMECSWQGNDQRQSWTFLLVE